MFGTELGKLGRRDRSLIEPRGLQVVMHSRDICVAVHFKKICMNVSSLEEWNEFKIGGRKKSI